MWVSSLLRSTNTGRPSIHGTLITSLAGPSQLSCAQQGGVRQRRTGPSHHRGRGGNHNTHAYTHTHTHTHTHTQAGREHTSVLSMFELRTMLPSLLYRFSSRETRVVSNGISGWACAAAQRTHTAGVTHEERQLGRTASGGRALRLDCAWGPMVCVGVCVRVCVCGCDTNPIV